MQHGIAESAEVIRIEEQRPMASTASSRMPSISGRQFKASDWIDAGAACFISDLGAAGG
jgi:hypothetical protein